MEMKSTMKPCILLIQISLVLLSSCPITPTTSTNSTDNQTAKLQPIKLSQPKHNNNNSTISSRVDGPPRTGFDRQYEVQPKIVNPHNFQYTINPKFETCGASSHPEHVFLLIYVHTTPKNYKRRISIRETWAKRSMFRDIRVVFMMGQTEEKDVQKIIDLEFNMYNDIVQENFADSYRNLTYKGVMAMKWISEYCSHAKYVLKTDDDIITNTFIILRHLYSLSKHSIYSKNSIMCLLWHRMGVQRDKKSKWYLPKETFEPDHFTPYCSGSAYMFTGDMPPKMYEKSKHIKFLWVDDYYITGLLTDAVNASQHSFASLYIISSGLVETRFFNSKQADFTVFGHIPNGINKMYRLWDFIYRSEVAKHPLLRQPHGTLIHPRDFFYIEQFTWSSQLWEPFLNKQLETAIDLSLSADDI